MPSPSEPLEKLGFLTIGSFDGADPGAGHETTLQVIELGEQLGFDSAWVRHRHLQYGISSPVAVLAAATQRTRRIALGTAVIPLGWENPLRLAEDLATVDVLSGGRLNPGVSVGPPMRYDEVRDALYPDTGDVEDFSYECCGCCGSWRVSRPVRSAAPPASRSSPTASSRTPPACATGCGTAGRASGRRSGPGRTASTSCRATWCGPRSRRTSRRSSARTSRRSGRTTRPGRRPAPRRGSS